MHWKAIQMYCVKDLLKPTPALLHSGPGPSPSNASKDHLAKTRTSQEGGSQPSYWHHMVFWDRKTGL